MGVGPLLFFVGSFGCIVNNFFPLVVHARRLCLNLNEEQPISVHRGPNLI